MLPYTPHYAVYPTVILADQPTEMVICAAERGPVFPTGAEYTVTLVPVDGDETNSYFPTQHTVLRVKAEGGVLRFTHTFAGEQEHTILLHNSDEKLLETLTVFSLREDLYALTPLRGDLHSHSTRSDGKCDPSSLVGYFREQGYDFHAVTDHNRFYSGYEIDETFADVKKSITRIPGEEVHAPGSVVHIVHTFGTSSVAARYIEDVDTYTEEQEAYLPKVPDHVPQQYRSRYAKAMWVTDRIHEAGGLAIFAHPYWRPKKSKCHNVCSEFAAILLKSGMFDAYELLGAMGQPGINQSVALWNDLRAEGLRIPVVGSSDVHPVEGSETFPHCFTICFAKENTPEAIKEAVKNGMTVAVEATGSDYGRQYRAYGSLRLVIYAQFLLSVYFRNRAALCAGEGAVLRAYAMGQASREAVELLHAQAEDYTLRFFGRKAPALPTEADVAFAEKWLANNAKTPGTRGSIIFPDYPMT